MTGQGAATFDKALVAWKPQPSVPVNGHETTAELVAVRKTVRYAVPGVCTAEMIPQKPPCNVKLPPLIVPASGCPIVPVTEYTPPVLVPPPPSMVYQSME